MSPDDRRAEGWRAFEQLAAKIYENLVPQGARVVHDDRIMGTDSGIERQIDVSVRFSVAGHEFLTIVQAKDHARPADVNVVGEFATVIADVGASKGVLICRSGFTPSAMTLACAKGIDLCNVHDASTERWALDIRVPVLWTDLKPVVSLGFQAYFEAGETIPADLKHWVISQDRGETRLGIFSTFERLWNSREISVEPETQHRIDGPPDAEILIGRPGRDPVWRPCTFYLEYTVERRAWLGDFSPEECTGLLHYADGRFVGQFPIGAIPRERGPEWEEVSDPDELVPKIPGTLITTEQWQVEPGSGAASVASITHESGAVIWPRSGGPADE